MSYTPHAGYKSQSNNSTTPLSSSGTFTGEAEHNGAPDVMVACDSDTAGTLYFDFSQDGTNWATFPTSGFVVSAGINEFHTAVKGPRYFRVRFVNGTSAQSYFRLSTYFGWFRQPSAPLNQAVGLDADALITRPSLPWLDVSRGLLTGVETVKKFGMNTAIGTSMTPISSSGVYQTPTAAVSLEFVSSSVNDALNSTGAHEITVVGLDANWEKQTVSTAAHATSGTTAVAISGTWLRVFRAYVSKSGAYASSSAGSHVGTITIRVAGAGATYAKIDLHNSFPLGQSLIGAYTIPAGYVGHVFLTTIGANSGKTVDIGFFARSAADDVSSSYTGTMRLQAYFTGISGGTVLNRTGAHVPLGPYTGPTDISFMGYVSTGTAEVSVEFEIFLVAV